MRTEGDTTCLHICDFGIIVIIFESKLRTESVDKILFFLKGKMDRYAYLHICNICIKWQAIAFGKTAMMTGAEAKNIGNKTNKKANKKEWKGATIYPLIQPTREARWER